MTNPKLKLDSNRTEMYLAERERKKVFKSKSNLEDYFNSLELEARVRIMDLQNLTRVAQLTQKTNQFNLTTIRYTEQDIDFLGQSKDSDILTLKANDKFGAYGLIGLAVLRYAGRDSRNRFIFIELQSYWKGLEDVLLEQCVKQARTKEKIYFCIIC